MQQGRRGLIIEIGGMFGSVAAMHFSQSAGAILQLTGSYWSLFMIAAGAYLSALLIIHVLAPKLSPAQIGA